jgi:hypothetical protein
MTLPKKTKALTLKETYEFFVDKNVIHLHREMQNIKKNLTNG